MGYNLFPHKAKVCYLEDYASQRSTALTDDQVQYSDHVVTKKESEQQRNETVIIQPTGVKRRVAKRAKLLPKTSTLSPSVRIKKKNTIRRRRHGTLASPKKYPRIARKPKKYPRAVRKKSQCAKIKDSLDTRFLNYAIRKPNNEMTILPNRQGVNCYIIPTGIRGGCIEYQIEQEGNPELCFYKECTRR